MTDGAIGLSLVMPNETFSRRHDVLPSFLDWICNIDSGVNAIDVKRGQIDHAQPDVTGPQCRPELDEGKRHRDPIVRLRGAIRQATGL